MDKEIWKPIRDFVCRYEVSSFGRIRSKLVGKKWKIRKLVPDKDGYLECVLRNNGKYYHKKVHRVVADTFIENPKMLKEVNHIDGNRKNNNVYNLEWSDRSLNNTHKTRVLGHYKGPFSPKRIKCVETNEVFPCVKAAAEFAGIKGESNISHAAKHKHKSGGFHWEYV